MIWIAVPVLIILFFFFLFGPQEKVISGECFSFEDFMFSSTDFYKSVRKTIEARGIPEIKFFVVKHSEGGLASANREYFRVSRKDHVFDICAAPFGNGFFVSWWLVENIDNYKLVIRKFPGLYALIYGDTYFQADTRAMFKLAVKSCVHEAMDSITKGNGVRSLHELENIPNEHSIKVNKPV
jgi:hypothetical protein